jgi:H+/Cl- antiporter ClcA
MLASALPAPFVGIGSALVLLVVVIIANLWQRYLWEILPASFGATATTWWWVLAVLTGTGLLVGLVVKYVPGHAGPDPATVSLFGPPTPLVVLPGLTLVLILALGGGVSLGPENPIIAIIVGLTVAIGTRLMPAVKPQGWVMLAAAGTIGAMFGTPVAAALLFSEMVSGDEETPAWDRLFAPLVAAGAGALTMSLFEQPSFTLAVDPYTTPHLIDIVSGIAVTLVAIAIGMIAVWIFPFAHSFFISLKHPVIMLTLGGFLLGLLGILGGPITMFKGLAEMKSLTAGQADYAVGGLAAIVAIKLVAILIAATCGFRGGRIFPMVFVGVAFGLLAHRLFPDIPMSLAIASSVLGFTLVVTRDGWLSLFMAAIMISGSGLALLPLLCIVILPAWLLLAGRPEMQIKAEAPASPDRTAGAAAGGRKKA